jgi:AraC family transcriptional regulator
LLNRLAACINCIGDLAANPFGGAIRHGDGAGTRPVAGQPEEREITQLLMLLLQELEAGAPSCRLYADSLTHALAVRIVLLNCNPSCEPRSRVSPLPQRVLRRVKDRIDAELAGDLTLSILAEESGYSRTHFQRMFRAATGLTPHEYLLERRLGRAQELLEKRNADLIDVAASCGFSSHSHMTTVFRRLHGVTPAEYRRNRRRSI